MAIAIFFSLVILVMGFKELYKEVDDFFGYLYYGFVHLFLMFVLFFIGIFTSELISSFLPKHWESNNIELIPLQNKDNCEENDNIYIGYDNGLLIKYYFIKKTDSGCIPESFIDEKNVTITENSDIKNGILIRSTKKLNHRFIANWLITERSWFLSTNMKYEFVLPKALIILK